jgi:hypothetical protein
VFTEPLPSKWISASGFEAMFKESLSGKWIIPSQYVDKTQEL